MKWIKASERLPEITNGYAVHIVLRWHFADNTPGVTNIQLRVTTANQFIDLIKTGVPDLTKIEWLDDTPPAPAIGGVKDWIDVNIEPDYGGEYNVLYDLEDGLEPIVSTMDFDKINHKWFDTRGANIECTTILKWQPLPSPPSEQTVKK